MTKTIANIRVTTARLIINFIFFINRPRRSRKIAEIKILISGNIGKKIFI